MPKGGIAKKKRSSGYAALFAVVNIQYGVGNGSTTFNLPDLRGEFIRGFDDDRGVDRDRVFGSHQSDQLQMHSHYSYSEWLPGPGGLATGGSGTPNAAELTSSPAATPGYAEPNVGTETRPRNVALLACIKY
jgi:microcystin-dependent protein